MVVAWGVLVIAAIFGVCGVAGWTADKLWPDGRYDFLIMALAPVVWGAIFLGSAWLMIP